MWEAAEHDAYDKVTASFERMKDLYVDLFNSRKGLNEGMIMAERQRFTKLRDRYDDLQRDYVLYKEQYQAEVKAAFDEQSAYIETLEQDVEGRHPAKIGQLTTAFAEATTEMKMAMQTSLDLAREQLDSVCIEVQTVRAKHGTLSNALEKHVPDYATSTEIADVSDRAGHRMKRKAVFTPEEERVSATERRLSLQKHIRSNAQKAAGTKGELPSEQAVRRDTRGWLQAEEAAHMSTEDELQAEKATYYRRIADQLQAEKAAHRGTTSELQMEKANHDVTKSDLEAERAAYKDIEAQLQAAKAACIGKKGELQTGKANHDVTKSNLQPKRAAYADIDAQLQNAKAAYGRMKGQLEEEQASHDVAKSELRSKRAAYRNIESQLQAEKVARNTVSRDLGVANRKFAVEQFAHGVMEHKYLGEKSAHEKTSALSKDTIARSAVELDAANQALERQISSANELAAEADRSYEALKLKLEEYERTADMKQRQLAWERDVANVMAGNQALYVHDLEKEHRAEMRAARKDSGVSQKQ